MEWHHLEALLAQPPSPAIHAELQAFQSSPGGPHEALRLLLEAQARGGLLGGATAGGGGGGATERTVFHLCGLLYSAARAGRWRGCFGVEESGAARSLLAGIVCCPQQPGHVRGKAVQALCGAAVASEFPERWPDHISWAQGLLAEHGSGGGGTATPPPRHALQLLQGTCEEAAALPLPESRRAELSALLRAASAGCIPLLLAPHLLPHGGCDAAAAFLPHTDPDTRADERLGLAPLLRACAADGGGSGGASGGAPAAALLLPLCHEVVEGVTLRRGTPQHALFALCLGVVGRAVADGTSPDTEALPVVLTLVERHAARLVDEFSDAFAGIAGAAYQRLLRCPADDEDALEVHASIWDSIADFAAMRADQGSSLRGGAESSDAAVAALRPVLAAFVSAVVPTPGVRCVASEAMQAAPPAPASGWYDGLPGRLILTASKACGVYSATLLTPPGSPVRESLARCLAGRDVAGLDVLMQLCAATAPDLLDLTLRGAGDGAAESFAAELILTHAAGVVRWGVLEAGVMGGGAGGGGGGGSCDPQVVSLVCHTLGLAAALCSVVKKARSPDTQRQAVALVGELCLLVATNSSTSTSSTTPTPGGGPPTPTSSDVVRHAGDLLAAYASRQLLPLLACSPALPQISSGLLGGATVTPQFTGYYVGLAKVHAASQGGPHLAQLFDHLFGSPRFGLGVAAEAVEAVTGEADCDASRRGVLWAAMQRHAAGLSDALSHSLSQGDAAGVEGTVQVLRTVFRWLHREAGRGFESHVVSALTASLRQPQGEGGGGSPTPWLEPAVISLCDLIELLVRPAKSPHVEDACLLCQRLVEPISRLAAPAASEAFTRLVASVIESHPQQSVVSPPPQVAAGPPLLEVAVAPLCDVSQPPQPAVLFEVLTWMSQLEKGVQLFSARCTRAQREGFALHLARLRLTADLHPELLAAALLLVSGGVALANAPPSSELACGAVEAFLSGAGAAATPQLQQALADLRAAPTYPSTRFNAALGAVKACLSA